MRTNNIRTRPVGSVSVQARLFGSDVHLSDRAIDVRVVRLRRAFDRLDVPGADLVRTCRGGGYLLAAEVTVL